MEVLQIALRVLHIAAAVALGGALVYQVVALQPALRELDPAVRDALRPRLLRRWSGVVWAGIAVLFITGLTTYAAFKIPEYRPRAYKGVYHALLGVKILAALLLFHAATMLVLPAAGKPKFAARARGFAVYGAVLLALIIALGGILRYLPALYT